MKKTVICIVLGFVLLTGGVFAKSDLSINLGFQDGFMYGVSNYNLFEKNSVFSLGIMEELSSSAIAGRTASAKFMLGFAMGFNAKDIVQFNIAYGPIFAVDNNSLGPGAAVELQIKFIPAMKFSPLLGVHYGFAFDVFGNSFLIDEFSVYAGFCINFGKKSSRSAAGFQPGVAEIKPVNPKLPYWPTVIKPVR